MNWQGLSWALGALSVLYGCAMMLPAVIDLYFQAGHALHFVFAGVMVISLGLFLMRLGGRPTERLTHRDGFLIVTLAWMTLSLLGSVPFLTTGTVDHVVDALFESTSGLTTTGATILSGLDGLPSSILFWRSMQEWFGGMGIIVLAVAVMPLLGVGGMQLFKAETPGPVKDKLTARVAETAKVLWFIYLAMTAVAALCFWWAGMDAFDAVNHAMCTVAIGGFSTHDASIAYFDDPLIRLLMVLFMILAGINFTLHFASFRRGFSLRAYFQDEEFRTYLKWLAFLVSMIGLSVLLSDRGRWDEVLFNTVSIATTTGFAVSDYSYWPYGATMLLFLAMFVGACAGSTGGGMKVVRVLLLFRQGMREIHRLIHPHGVMQIKLGGQRIEPRIVEALWGFFVLYVVCFAVISVLLAMAGVDMLTALSAAGACLTNTGPGFGAVGPASTYADLPVFAKGVLLSAMVLGRLEIFSFFVLLVPEFWRK